MRVLWMCLAIAAIACGGGSGGGETGCRSNAECGGGLVCVVPPGGAPGTCQPPPLAVALTAPAAGARVGPAGVAVSARVTLASTDGSPPAALAIYVDGAEAGALAPASRDGAAAVYTGAWTPPANALGTPSLFVAARTSAGLVPSDGVFLDVDTKPPTLRLVTGPACGLASACPRDGALDVFVAVAEDHPGVVEATVDLDGYALAIPFGPAQIGTDLTVSIPLARYPFPRFSGTAQVRVRARDAYGNEAVLDGLPPFPVTRLRWAADLRDQSQSALKLTGAVIRPSGDVVVGGSDGKLHGVTPDGQPRLPMNVSSLGISSAPAMGASVLWVGSDDGKLYGRTGDGIVFGCPATAPVGAMFTPAVRLGTAEEAYSAGAVGKMYGATADGKCAATSATTGAVSVPPVIVGGKVYALASDATLRRFSDSLADESWSVAAPSCADVPAAMTYGSGSIFFACGIAGLKAEVHAVDLATSTGSLLATLPSKPNAPAVFISGDLLLGTNDGKLHRLTPPPSGSGAWTDLWSSLPALGASVRGVLAGEQDGDGVVAYATTADGQLHALRADGSARWSTAGETSSPLGVSPLSFPTIAPAAGADRLPTLYVGSDDGHLYAVVVDKALDPRSPWPKAHHDARNTGDADAPVTP